MNINPVAANMAALQSVSSSPGKDGDGDHGVEPSSAPAAQPPLPSGSTYSVYS